MRRWCLAGLLLVAACKPKVDLRSPFDEDDPRANGPHRYHEAIPIVDLRQREASARPPAEPPPPPPIPIPGAGVRGGQVLRADLQPVLDAGPAAFLGWFETEAVSEGGQFVGWRLVKLLPAGQALARLDLVPDDVLIAVNGRPLSKPDELGDLWTELYAAGAIVAEIHRGGERFTLRFAILGPPLPAPSPR